MPIVALTAHAMTGDRDRCLAAGMDGYVSKPLRPAELFAAIAALLSPRSDAGDTAGQPADVSVPAPLDADGLLAAFGGNRTLLGEVIDLSLADMPTMLAEARSAVERGDAGALAASAHALKGALGLFAQAGAYDAARRLEQSARSGDLSAVDRTFAELDAAAKQLSADLQAVRQSLRDTESL